MWPEIGWEINEMPGFGPRPSMTYVNQVVPPPRRAYVEKDVSVADIIFDPGMRVTEPQVDNSKQLATTRYQECHVLARRLVSCRNHVYHLKKQKRESEDAREDCVDDFVFDSKTAAFVLLLDECSKEIDNASKFQKRMVKHLNPKAGTIDRMFAFPISQHCKTTHEGMKKVYADVGQAFQMFALNENGTTKLHPNAKKRKINLHVDGLTARNFRKLKYNLTRKLTEMGSVNYIVPMLEALERITCQHDLFHETRLHCQDCIYRTKYGCFLQPLQVLLSWKRINDDPVNNCMQEHELCFSSWLKRHFAASDLCNTLKPPNHLCLKQALMKHHVNIYYDLINRSKRFVRVQK